MTGSPTILEARPSNRERLIEAARNGVLWLIGIVAFACFFFAVGDCIVNYTIIRSWQPVQVRVLSAGLYSARDQSRGFRRSTSPLYGVEHRLERLDDHHVGVARSNATTAVHFLAELALARRMREMPPGSIISARQNPKDPAQMSLATGYDWNTFRNAAELLFWAVALILFDVWLARATTSLKVTWPVAVVPLLLLLPLLSSCTLDKVTTAEPEDVVIAEITLRTGLLKQIAFLHHTLGSGAAGDSVPGAEIQITAPGNRIMRFTRTLLTDCVTDRPAREQLGTCYATVTTNNINVDAGAQYALRIALPDGKVMTSVTTVPNDFHFVHPPLGVGTCTVPPLTPIELTWTSSSNAWVYLNETNLSGLRAAYAGQGIEVSSDPMRLVGLSISAADTTIVFPGEFGIFDRGDDARGDLLVALQKGLPPNTTARVMVAAGDRNYVNWARGGNFNPSGPVRVPSIRGDGTGVFGSLHNRTINIRVGTPTANAPSCQ